MHLSIPVLLCIGLTVALADPIQYYAREPVRRTRQLDQLLRIHGERPENYEFKLPREYYYFNQRAGFPPSAFNNGGPGSSKGPRGPPGPRGPSGFGPVGSSFRRDPSYYTDDRLTVHDPQANSLLGVIL